MHILIIMNPAAGRGKTQKLLPKLESLLKADDVTYEVHRTDAPKHAVEITRELRENFDVVAAFGGDGTMNEVLNGLAETGTPMAVIPIGTGNDFARSCGIPLDMEKAVNILLKAKTKRIDLGKVNGHYFCNVVGAGFDAFTSQESRKIKRLRGTLVYVYAVMKSLGKYTSIPMTVELDDITLEKPTYLVCVGNGWSVGGGLQLTPDAILNDGYFTVCHIDDISSMKVVRNFLKLVNGKINDMDEVTIHQSKRVKITSEIPLPVHIDGEFPEGEVKILDIEIIPEGIAIVGDWEQERRRISDE